MIDIVSCCRFRLSAFRSRLSLGPILPSIASRYNGEEPFRTCYWCQNLMTRIVSFVVLLAIVIVVGIVWFEVLSSFVLPLFIAVLLVIMFRPLHEAIVRRLGGRVRLAAAVTTTTILLMVLIPMMWVLARAATETVSLVSELKHDDLAGRFANMRRKLGLDGPPKNCRRNSARSKPRWRTARKPDSGRQFHRPGRSDLAARVDQGSGPLELATRCGFGSGRGSPHGNQRTHGRQPGHGMHQSVVGMQTAIRALDTAQNDRAGSIEAVVRADTALRKLKSQLLGSPVIVWLKDQLNLNKNQFDDLLIKVRETAGPLALGTTQFISNFLLDFVVGLVVMVVGLYYFLADGPEMISALMRLSPLDDRYKAQLLAQFSELTRAVILAMLLAAVVQGLLAGIGYFLVDFGNVFMLTVVTTVFAMVPFVGATAVWGGCCRRLFCTTAGPQAAIGLAIYGTIVVSVADNLIKPMVLHGRSNLHPLLAVVQRFGGSTRPWGAIGIVLGPIVVAFLQTLLVMLRGAKCWPWIRPKPMAKSNTGGHHGWPEAKIRLRFGTVLPATTLAGGEK